MKYDHRWRDIHSEHFNPAADMLWWLEFWRNRNINPWKYYDPND